MIFNEAKYWFKFHIAVYAVLIQSASLLLSHW